MIEKLDKLRYNLLKWFTVGYTIWFGGFILKDMISNYLILGLIILIGSFGWIIFFISLIQFWKLMKIVNSDSVLKNALNDELMIHNRNKAFYFGYWTYSILIGIFFMLSIFTDISALIVSEISLYIGTISILGFLLIYNRD